MIGERAAKELAERVWSIERGWLKKTGRFEKNICEQ
jgi:hypothetical protein